MTKFDKSRYNFRQIVIWLTKRAKLIHVASGRGNGKAGSRKAGIVKTISLTEKRNQKQNDVTQPQFVAGIKQALRQNCLSQINVAACALLNHPTEIAGVIAQLNAATNQNSLAFRWFPASQNQSSKLLIRNQSIGLLITASPNAIAEGIRMTPGGNVPFCSMSPQLVLSVLSAQMRNTKMPCATRVKRRNLQLVWSQLQARM